MLRQFFEDLTTVDSTLTTSPQPSTSSNAAVFPATLLPLFVLAGIVISRFVSRVLWQRVLVRILFPILSESERLRAEIAELRVLRKKYNSPNFFTTCAKIDRKIIVKQKALDAATGSKSFWIIKALSILVSYFLEYGFILLVLFEWRHADAVFVFPSNWCLPSFMDTMRALPSLLTSSSSQQQQQQQLLSTCAVTGVRIGMAKLVIIYKLSLYALATMSKQHE